MNRDDENNLQNFTTLEKSMCRGFVLRHKAFTLIEGILALALFAAAATTISQVCYNCLFPLNLSDKSALYDALSEQFLTAISTVSDYDSLQDGIEVEGLDGETYQITGDAEPTEILNLFKLTIKAQKGMKENTTTVFVVRPNSWYEQTNEREDLLTDRTDFLEEQRRAKEIERE